MNTTPDETRLALWLEDELEAEESLALDGWVREQRPELWAERERIRAWKSWLRQGMQDEAVVPHAEFFHARIARETRRLPQDRSSRKFRWLAVASVAGMMVSFWLGGRMQGAAPVAVAVAPAPAVVPAEPPLAVLYTPESRVGARAFASEAAGGTVIVLDGVDALPDTLDAPDAADAGHGHTSTAGNFTGEPES